MFKKQTDAKENTFSSETAQQKPLVQSSTIITGTMQLNPIRRGEMSCNTHTQKAQPKQTLNYLLSPP